MGSSAARSARTKYSAAARALAGRYAAAASLTPRAAASAAARDETTPSHVALDASSASTRGALSRREPLAEDSSARMRSSSSDCALLPAATWRQRGCRAGGSSQGRGALPQGSSSRRSACAAQPAGACQLCCGRAHAWAGPPLSSRAEMAPRLAAGAALPRMHVHVARAVVTAPLLPADPPKAAHLDNQLPPRRIQVRPLVPDHLRQQLPLQAALPHRKVHRRGARRDGGREVGVGQARGNVQFELGGHVHLPVA